MTLLDERYGGVAPQIAEPSNDVIDLMLSHRSVRRFADRPLPDGLLELLIAAGQSAATSSNMQTASVVAVTEPERRRALAAMASQAFPADAPVVLCFVLDLSRPTRIGEALGADLWALPMLDKFLAAFGDCALFAQNVVLAAESKGLGGCFIGNLRKDPVALAEMLELPPRCFVVFGLCLGYEAGTPTGIRPRLPQEVVLHRETYSTAQEAERLADYDRRVAKHEAGQGRPAEGWTGRHPARFASADYLGGREKLREILLKLDLPLK